MRILITGASCAGSTTLGKALSEVTGFPYFDTDDYFWESTQPAFTQRRVSDIRNNMFRHDLSSKSNYIIGGSLMGWDEGWQDRFDLIVSLYVPKEIRLQRLKDREVLLHEETLYNNPVKAEKFKAFLTWATGYDDNTTTGRNIGAHRSWLRAAKCTVLEISGDTTVSEMLDTINKYIKIHLNAPAHSLSWKLQCREVSLHCYGKREALMFKHA